MPGDDESRRRVDLTGLRLRDQQIQFPPRFFDLAATLLEVIVHLLAFASAADASDMAAENSSSDAASGCWPFATGCSRPWEPVLVVKLSTIPGPLQFGAPRPPWGG